MPTDEKLRTLVWIPAPEGERWVESRVEGNEALRWIWNHILPGLAAALNPLMAGIRTAPRSGSALAPDPALAGVNARYFPSMARWKEAPSSEESYDAARARELWEASVRMTELAPGESLLRAERRKSARWDPASSRSASGTTT
jgi:hypothetical protein